MDDNVYVFSRGPFVIVLTNVGEPGPSTVTNNTVITIPGLPKRFHSSRLRNIYDKQVSTGPGTVELQESLAHPCSSRPFFKRSDIVAMHRCACLCC